MDGQGGRRLGCHGCHLPTPAAAGPVVLAVAPPGTPMGDSGPGHGPAAGMGEGAPVTRRLLLVAGVVAVLGLAATPALEETTAGGWLASPGMAARSEEHRLNSTH